MREGLSFGKGWWRGKEWCGRARFHTCRFHMLPFGKISGGNGIPPYGCDGNGVVGHVSMRADFNMLSFGMTL
jgi:hypothetical protein